MNDMSDQEKSVLLAKAMGTTQFRQYDDGGDYIGNLIPPPANLYDPANMALAWRVLNWGMASDTLWKRLADWWLYRDTPSTDGWYTMTLPPAEAQRAWLDKVLELAIEADLIEVPND
jgi:hypothetical protein